MPQNGMPGPIHAIVTHDESILCNGGHYRRSNWMHMSRDASGCNPALITCPDCLAFMRTHRDADARLRELSSE